MELIKILDRPELPEWVTYPPEYIRLIEEGIVRFSPWYLLDEKLAQLRLKGLQSRYPNRKLYAFAARFDNDDIACWGEKKDGHVILIHDFASDDYAVRGEFNSFWDWFRSAIEAMIGFEP